MDNGKPDRPDTPPYHGKRLHRREQLTLAAVDSAVSCARMFTRCTLDRWEMDARQDDALLVVSELVTNAVRATGIAADRPGWGKHDGLNLIHVHLLALDENIALEVWDVSTDAPAIPAQNHEAEGGRGLLLVQELSHRWGCWIAGAGKVVWAEMAQPVPTMPRRRQHTGPTIDPNRLPEADLLLRVLHGLHAI